MQATFDIILGIFHILAVILRIAGAAVLGLALGWFILEALKRNFAWYFQAVLLVVVFGFFGWIITGTSAGVVGALTLCTGLALLLWGRKKETEKKE